MAKSCHVQRIREDLNCVRFARTEFSLKDPIAKSLNLLADGLRPYVADRAQAVLRRDISADIANWDAQQLLLFIWDRWNDFFRGELSFIERSVVSELREFRNRWAHQDSLSEQDVYRFLDGVERLLQAAQSPVRHAVGELRRESLNRLWQNEIAGSAGNSLASWFWPYLICGSCSAAISMALVMFLSSPWCWILSLLILLATMRVAWIQTQREAQQGPGPRECSHCGRIIYSVDCPYCSGNNFNRPHFQGEPRPRQLQTESVVISGPPGIGRDTHRQVVSRTQQIPGRLAHPAFRSAGPGSDTEPAGESDIERLRR
jgi:Swt1-like HEPN